MLRILLCLCLFCVLPALAAPPQIASFEPLWQGNPASDFRADYTPERLLLEVNEPGKGMKWQSDGLPTAAFSPWLSLTYRATGLATERMDYLVWGMSFGRQKQLLPASLLVQDGEPHILTLDLMRLGMMPLEKVAFCVQAGDEGPGSLEILDLALLEAPPERIDWPEVSEVKTLELPFDSRLAFEAEPGWLGNPAEAHTEALFEGHWRFSVDEVGKGMKWAVTPQPVFALKDWQSVQLRYRAWGLAPNPDYAVYLGANGDEPHYLHLIPGTGLIADGRWRTVQMDLAADWEADVLAVQLYAARAGAWLEVDFLKFASERVPLASEDVLEVKPLETIKEGFTPLQLPDLASPASMLGAFAVTGLEPPKATGLIEALEVPFRLEAGRGFLTGLSTQGRSELPLAAEGRELLILGLTAAPQTGFDFIGEPTAAISSYADATHFRVGVRYSDGTVDEYVPYSVGANLPIFLRGLDVWAVPLRQDVRAEALVLFDDMGNGALGLLAVTANAGPPLAVSAPAAWTVPECKLAKPKPFSIKDYDIGVAEYPFAVTSKALDLELESAPVPKLKRIDSAYARGHFALKPAPLYRIRVNGQEVPVEAWLPYTDRVILPDERFYNLHFEREARLGEVRLKVRLDLSPSEDDDIQLALKVTLEGAPAKVEVLFPNLEGLQVGTKEATWYLLPSKSLILSNEESSFKKSRGGDWPLQFADFFNPVLGAGLMVSTRDKQGLYWWGELSKHAGGVDFAQRYLAQPFEPGEEITLAPVYLGAHAGGWREAIALYKDWAATWYKPAVPRKDWWRDVYCFRQHFLTEGLYDRETQQFDFQPVLDQDTEAFGKVDYLHIFDWSSTPEYGRVGDYDHWEALGGLPNIQRGFDSVRKQGVPLGLYLEGYLIDEKSDIAKAGATDWQLIGEGGQKLYWPKSQEMFVCSAVEARRDYAADVYRQLTTLLPVDGLYIDQFGFEDASKLCYAENHGHKVPTGPLEGELMMTKAIREAARPGVAIYTEEWPADIVLPYQDGAFCYSVIWAEDRYNAPRLHLPRFVFPDFKSLQLVRYAPFINGDYHLAQFAFFNGEGLWLQGMADSSYDGPSLAFLKKALGLENKYAEAFRDMAPVALFPTLLAGVYANRFESATEVVFTLYNANPHTVRGPLLSVEASLGEAFDAWRELPAASLVEEGKLIVSAELEPLGVGCLVLRKPAD